MVWRGADGSTLSSVAAEAPSTYLFPTSFSPQACCVSELGGPEAVDVPLGLVSSEACWNLGGEDIFRFWR